MVPPQFCKKLGRDCKCGLRAKLIGSAYEGTRCDAGRAPLGKARPAPSVVVPARRLPAAVAVARRLPPAVVPVERLSYPLLRTEKTTEGRG